MAFVKNNITIEGARVIFRDFSGEKNRFNDDRTFSVVLEDSLAERLQEDGWPVKWLEPRNDEESRTPILTVKVYFGKVPPQIVMISGGTKKELNESNVNVLDWANFENVDLKIRPFNYEFNGKSSVKPYLKSLWVTIREDELENKYRDIPYAKDRSGDDDEEGLPFN